MDQYCREVAVQDTLERRAADVMAIVAVFVPARYAYDLRSHRLMLLDEIVEGL
jgi:hypothetical protein